MPRHGVSRKRANMGRYGSEPIVKRGGVAGAGENGFQTWEIFIVQAYTHMKALRMTPPN